MARRKKGNPREPRRWTFVASAMMVGLLVVGAVFVVLSSPGDGESRAEPTRSTPTVVATPTGSDGCKLTDTGQQLPTEAPSDVDWKLWRGGALPISKSAGPGRVDEQTGFTSCYAHTPVGAAMAAMNIVFRMSLAAPDTTIVDQQVAEGPHKADLREIISEYDPPEDSIAQIAGFQVSSYDKSQALVDIAVGDARIGYIHTKKLMTWQDGTWRMVATADDLETRKEWQDLEDLDDHIEFRGVG